MRRIRRNPQKRCQCADWGCLKADQGMVYHMERHKTRKEVLAYILKQACWRGAKVRQKDGIATLTKGSSVLNLRLT